MLKLNDLKNQGLTLSKMDAQELHSTINHIAQRGGDSEVVFAGNGDARSVKISINVDENALKLVGDQLIQSETKVAEHEAEINRLKSLITVDGEEWDCVTPMNFKKAIDEADDSDNEESTLGADEENGESASTYEPSQSDEDNTEGPAKSNDTEDEANTDVVTERSVPAKRGPKPKGK